MQIILPLLFLGTAVAQNYDYSAQSPSAPSSGSSSSESPPPAPSPAPAPAPVTLPPTPASPATSPQSTTTTSTSTTATPTSTSTTTTVSTPAPTSTTTITPAPTTTTTTTAPTTSTTTSTTTPLTTTPATTSTTVTTATPSTATTTTPGSVTSPQGTTATDSLSACGTSGIVCHVLQATACSETGAQACEYLAKIGQADAGSVLIELSATGGGSELNLDVGVDRWIGVGFSLSGLMPNSAVFHCFHDANGTIQGKLTYNVPTAHFNIGWQTVDQAPITIQSTQFANNALRCVAKLQKQFSVQGQAFDLTKTVTMIGANGPLVQNTIAMHDKAHVPGAQVSFP